MLSCQWKHFSITGLELPNKSQWQYFYISLKNENWTFFPGPLFPSQPANNHSQARINQAAGIWHTCVHHPHRSNTWVQEHWVYTPGKGEDRVEELARGKVSWVDTGSKAWWKPFPPVWGRKVHAQLSFLFLFNISCATTSMGERNCSLPEAQPASQPFGNLRVDLGRDLLTASLKHSI